MVRGKKVGKCYCGGSIMKYESEGFLPETVKCNRCGSGDISSAEGFGKQELKKIVKELGSEEGY